tara:strand:+ start:1119 stop:2360 length:1242 start_codon:yes stop_codon:yes gene_type:complete
MIFIYRILINLIFFLSPIIILIRLIKKKENIKRFREKLCFFSEKKLKGKVIWFHGASVGELQSIVPLIEKIGKDNTVKQILITSNTLSSSKVIQKLKIKKVTHQFFPVDTNFLSKKFLDYWKPSSAFFIDSEIWPNMIFNLKKRNIPINLINGRITKKTFKRWKKVSKFSKSIFSKLDLCLSSSLESKKYLKKLGAQKVKFIGNLKFSQSEKKNIKVNSDFKKFIFSKRIWCASSTHENEEQFCGSVHKELNKKYKNLLTVIIPRHVERADIIKNTLENMDLKVHLHEPRKKIDEDTNIYIVNAYGQTKSFYDICKNVFLGGSLVNRGGQNPLEAARYGCNILHGPNVMNFKEIYEFLKKNNISIKVSKKREMFNHLSKLFMRKKPSRKIKNRLNLIGRKILDTTYKEVKFTY